MVFVKLHCNGREIKPQAGRYVKVQIPAAELVSSLLLWQGAMDGNKLTGWAASTNPTDIYWAEWPAGGNQVSGYEIIAKDLGWLCAARVIPGTLTDFCIQMPPGFDAENSRAFLLLKNNNSVFSLQPNPDNGLFCVDGVPAGYPVQLITLSKLGQQFLLGNIESEIGTNSKVVVPPQQTGLSEIIQIIRNL
jgi:hypothetical protein